MSSNYVLSIYYPLMVPRLGYLHMIIKFWIFRIRFNIQTLPQFIVVQLNEMYLLLGIGFHNNLPELNKNSYSH